MARKKPDVWACGHPMPIEVTPVREGRRARCLRCLRCGWCGPVRPDAEGALLALQDTVSRQEKIGS